MGTSKRGWRELLDEVVEAAKVVGLANEWASVPELKKPTRRLTAKREELVEAVEKEYQRGWDDAMKPHVEASYD